MTTYGWMCDDGHRYGVMCAVAEAGGLSVIHAEDDEIARWLTKKYVREGKTHGAYIGETRPRSSRKPRCAAHSCSPSGLAPRSTSCTWPAAAAVDALGEKRASRACLVAARRWRYLSFTADALWEDERGLLYNNYPTIKTQADQDVLWSDRGRSGAGRDLGSLPHQGRGPDDEDGRDDRGPPVRPGRRRDAAARAYLHTLGVAGGKLTLERLVQLTSTNPARLMGLYPKKGTIAPGSDADLVLFDPNRRWTVELRPAAHGLRLQLLGGLGAPGPAENRPHRGEVVIEDGNVVGSRTGGVSPRSIPSRSSSARSTPALTAPRKGALAGAAP